MFTRFFSYESPFYQLLLKFTRLVALNVLFLICCLPIITIGAAQAGMMNAARVLQDPTDDGSCFQAFFRGFASGFGKVTAIWLVCFAMLLVLAYSLYVALCFDAALGNAPVIPAVFGLAVVLLIQTMSVAFHSRFDCSALKIVRNSWFMLFMHPIRTVCMTLVTWLPVIVLVLDTAFFLLITPLWLFGYYSIAYQLNARLMRKPFQKVEEQLFPQPEEAFQDSFEE